MSNILLCVDDSATMQIVAEITFRGSDWEYAGAKTADEARAAASSKSPSLILVDAVMPGCSGYDLAKELKASNSSAVVVMMCGNSEAYDESKGSASGCHGHVIKPWQTDKLIEQLVAFSNADAPAASAAPTASAAPAAPAAAPAAPAAPDPAVAAAAPAAAKGGKEQRSATLMGMPALEVPVPSKPLPAGVSSIKPAASKPAVPSVRTPPPPVPRAAPKVAAKAVSIPTPKPPAAPAMPTPTQKVVAKSVPTPAPVPTPTPAPAPTPALAARAPMIKEAPGKPIRLVLASQVEASAKSAAQSGGMSADQASALGEMSRDMLERIIWDVVPQLAESIIRENLDTLSAKSR